MRVLLLEDEASVAEPLAQALRREGFEPVVASTVADALELSAQIEFGFVLLDLTLPDGDGRDVCRALRRTSSVPIVMLTARGSPSSLGGSVSMGTDHDSLAGLSHPGWFGCTCKRWSTTQRRRCVSRGNKGDNAVLTRTARVISSLTPTAPPRTTPEMPSVTQKTVRRGSTGAGACAALAASVASAS